MLIKFFPSSYLFLKMRKRGRRLEELYMYNCACNGTRACVCVYVCAHSYVLAYLIFNRIHCFGAIVPFDQASFFLSFFSRMCVCVFGLSFFPFSKHYSSLPLSLSSFTFFIFLNSLLFHPFSVCLSLCIPAVVFSAIGVRKRNGIWRRRVTRRSRQGHGWLRGVMMKLR